MTREQRWVRSEMRPLLRGRRDDVSPSLRAHYEARLRTLRSILQILKKAQRR